MGASAFVLLAEITWVATLFMRLCVRSDSKMWKCWCTVTWFSGWKKSLVYGPLGAVPIIWPHKLWLSYVSGGQLIALALLHGILSVKGAKKGRRRRKDHLIHAEIDSIDSSKFEEVTECIDDSLPEPIPGSSHSISDSLLEQDTVLEI